MSTELKTIEESQTNPEMHLTSFFGGIDRGRCVQLTQRVHTDIQQLSTHECVQLTQQQAIDMIVELTNWINENPTASSVLADQLTSA